MNLYEAIKTNLKESEDYDSLPLRESVLDTKYYVVSYPESNDFCATYKNFTKYKDAYNYLITHVDAEKIFECYNSKSGEYIEKLDKVRDLEDKGKIPISSEREDYLQKVDESELDESIKTNLKEADDTIKERKIPIDLNDEKSKEIINAVCGQLSDGIWENSPGMDKYWQFMGDLDDNGNLTVYNGYKRSYDTMSPWCYSAFNDMDDDAVKKYYANKIKQIVKQEGLDWDRNNTKQCDYLDYHSGVTVRDAYKVYDRLLGRIDRIVDSEKLKESNINESGPYYIGPKEYCMIAKNDEDSDLLSLYLDNNKYAEEVIPKNWSEDKIRKLAGKISNSEGPRGDRDFVKEVEQESLINNLADSYLKAEKLINADEDTESYFIGATTIKEIKNKVEKLGISWVDFNKIINNRRKYLRDLNESETELKTFTIKEEFYSLEKLQGVIDNPNRLALVVDSWRTFAGGVTGTDYYFDCYSADYDWTKKDIREFMKEKGIKKYYHKGKSPNSPYGDIGAKSCNFEIVPINMVENPYHYNRKYYLVSKSNSQLNESENTLFCIQDTSHPDFTDKGYQTTQSNNLITFTNKEDAQKYIDYLNTFDKDEYKIVDATTFDKDKIVIFNTFDEYKKSLNESETEDYWDATELDRVGFMALLKFNNPEKHANPSMKYIITNDNNEVYRFAMEGSTEKIKDIGAKIEFRKYLNNKEDEQNIEGFDNFEIPAYNIKGVFNKDTGEVIYTVGSNSTNRNEYRKNINDLKQEEFPSTHEGIVRKYIENTILKESEGPYNQAFKVGSKLDLLLSELNTELSKCLKDMGYDEEFKKDYTSIEAKENENNTEIYFIAELDYKEGEKIVQQLDNIISKYDKDAYFEAEDTGRWVAVINKNMNESEDGIIPQSKFKNMTDEDLDNYVKFLKEELMYHTTEKQKELQKDIEKIEQILRDRDFYIDSSNEDAYNIEIVKGWKDMTQEELDKYIEDNK